MNKKIYFNGKIITVDKHSTIVEAILVEDGKIKALGSNEEILNMDEGADKIDLKNKTMLPGFIDPHGHIVAIAQTIMLTDFGQCNSKEELLDIIKNKISKNPPKQGEWFIGFGYDNTKYVNEEHPTKFDLDKISSEIPMFVTHASGHLAVVNSKALELMGYVGEDYIVPEGGVVRTVSPDSKEPNGVLEENACLDPEKKKCIPAPSFETLMNAIAEAQNIYAAYGITTSQDASVDTGMNQLLLGAAQANVLKLDIVGFAVQQVTMDLLKDEGTPKRDYFNHYKLLGGKTWLDGSPQGKTAWLTKPYLEVPKGQDENYCGYGTQDDETVTAYFKSCIERNIQVNVHTNGDAAADQFIRCYERALELTNNKTDLRPVMVHAQTVREDQLDKMKELGILPTFFLDHIWFWGDYHYNSVFGAERANRLSPAGSALKRNMNFTLHQDPPVKMPNQILAIHNAVNRKTQSGRVLGEDQRISVLDAIKAVTINGAYQYFEEDIKGSIEVGKYADLVILDKNPLEISSDEISKIQVLETIKEGNTIFVK